MTEILHQPGFLGTTANFAADFTLVLMVLTAGLFTVGLVMARKRHYGIHRWIQTSAAALNAILVLWMMILPFRDFIIRDQGGPRPAYFYSITVLHALIGAAAFSFGIFVTLRGNELVPDALKFNNYKGFMRVAYSLYMAATLLGILVYWTWFVRVPNPPLY